MAEQNLEISQLAKKDTVVGTEMIPVAEDGANYSITPEQIKDYSQPDLSGYAKKTGDEFTGAVGTTQLSITKGSQGAMAAILANANDIQFRTMNAGVSSMTFNVQSATPLKITESGILENGTLLENKYAKKNDLDNLATKEELGGKVGGTGVTSIQVVDALPESPAEGVMYVVTAAETA